VLPANSRVIRREQVDGKRPIRRCAIPRPPSVSATLYPITEELPVIRPESIVMSRLCGISTGGHTECVRMLPVRFWSGQTRGLLSVWREDDKGVI
jgi:hypothetical protein